MPIRKTDKGWFWGSKGPFASKAKALSVARAAYASGYKEQSDMDAMSEFVCRMLQAVKETHILHLQTRSYAAHQALGSFYPELDEITDGIAESYQGKYGKLIEYAPFDYEALTSALEYMIAMSEYVQETRSKLPQDSELQNEIDNIQNLINSTLYKLRFLS